MRRSLPHAIVVAMALSPVAAHAQLDVTPDVVYGHKDGMALTYDVLRPTGPTNGAGVVYMVSGGWVSRWTDPRATGSRGLIAELTARGFTTFLVRHGSSPRYKVPEAVDDARLAVAHIRENAQEFGIDPTRIGLTGTSAGGHLSLTVGLRAEGPTGWPDAPPAERPHQVAAIVAYFPPVDVRQWVGPNERFPALDFDPELAIGSSPILFVSDDDPPTLLLHGDEDGLVPLSHSERMHAALEEAGVVNDFVIFPGAGHGFRGEDARRGVELSVEWFERHLVGGSGRE
jgi:acetyl esterase/lipase